MFNAAALAAGGEALPLSVASAAFCPPDMRESPAAAWDCARRSAGPLAQLCTPSLLSDGVSIVRFAFLSESLHKKRTAGAA